MLDPWLNTSLARVGSSDRPGSHPATRCAGQQHPALPPCGSSQLWSRRGNPSGAYSPMCGLPILTSVFTPSPSTTPAGFLATVTHAVWDGFWMGATSSPWTAAGLMILLTASAVRMVHAIAHPGGGRDPVRRFPHQDRATILARAGRRCEHHGWLFGRCNQTERLEADHVHPHSRGGQTAVANGQALCRRHNMAKGARIPFNWQLGGIERHRAAYFPAGTPRTVTRKLPRRR